MTILSFLPSKNERPEVIRKRYNDIIRAVARKTYYEGILLDARDKDVQEVLRALLNAMDKPIQQNKRASKKYSGKGKTARDHASLSRSNDKKRAKSDESKKVRAEMKGRCGKQ